MSGAKSRNKGANYERRIAKLFEEWSGWKMRRTPLSGGWAQGSPMVSGDIVCVDPDKLFPFSIECKCSESWNWEQVNRQEGPVFKDWWVQAAEECAPGKIPVLVFSRNRYDDYILLSVADLPPSVELIGTFTFFIWNDPYVIMRLSDFLGVVTVNNSGALQSVSSANPLRE